jgi:hypothetical protein
MRDLTCGLLNNLRASPGQGRKLSRKTFRVRLKAAKLGPPVAASRRKPDSLFTAQFFQGRWLATPHVEPS